MEDTVTDDAAHLKSLRLAAGLDLAQLAALSNLSAGQVRQLEEGGESLFYSAQIKAQSMRRVIRMLESPTQMADTEHSDPASGLKPSANVIDDIIRLSEKSLNSRVVHSEVRRRRSGIEKWVALAALVIGSLGWAVWQSNQHGPHNIYAEWVEPLSTKVSATPTEAVPAVVPNEPAPYKAEKLTTEAVTPTVTPTVPPTVAAVAPVSPSPIEPPVTPVKPVVPVVAPAATPELANKPSPCTSIQTEPLRVSNPASRPTKPGTYVYLVASKAMEICVDDGKRKHTLVTLTPGAGRTVHGQSPWTITTQDLSSVQIYFQGAKVGLPADAGQRVLLTEQAVSP